MKVKHVGFKTKINHTGENYNFNLKQRTLKAGHLGLQNSLDPLQMDD